MLLKIFTLIHFSLSGASKNQMGAAVTLPPASLLVLLVKTHFSLLSFSPR